jgi:hypothetical protein
MKSLKTTLLSVWNFYIDGFKNMTWGRVLWGVIFLKLFIMFAILRIFFFQPVMAGKTDEQKSDFVGEKLIENTILID